MTSHILSMIWRNAQFFFLIPPPQKKITPHYLHTQFRGANLIVTQPPPDHRNTSNCSCFWSATWLAFHHVWPPGQPRGKKPWKMPPVFKTKHAKPFRPWDVTWTTWNRTSGTTATNIVTNMTSIFWGVGEPKGIVVSSWRCFSTEVAIAAVPYFSVSFQRNFARWSVDVLQGYFFSLEIHSGFSMTNSILKLILPLFHESSYLFHSEPNLAVDRCRPLAVLCRKKVRKKTGHPWTLPKESPVFHKHPTVYIMYIYIYMLIMFVYVYI